MEERKEVILPDDVCEGLSLTPIINFDSFFEMIKNKDNSKDSYSGTLKMKKKRSKKWKNGKK